MTAVSTTEWLAALALGVGGFALGAVAILALDHPRLQRAVGLPLAALVLFLTPTTPKEDGR